MPGRPIRRLVLLALLLGSLAGCGYRLVGTSSTLPEHVKVIALLPFENLTQRPGIEQRVTEAVASALSRRGKYSVATDRAAADAVLEGAVSSYRSNPVEFDPEGRYTRVEVVVTVQASLRDTSNDAVLWSQAGLIFKEQYDVQPEEIGFFDRENVAQDEIAEGVAGVLVTSMFEGF
jgi:outer membrane lipopolysaccharide assembly protein LptE/RlpB